MLRRADPRRRLNRCPSALMIPVGTPRRTTRSSARSCDVTRSARRYGGPTVLAHQFQYEVHAWNELTITEQSDATGRDVDDALDVERRRRDGAPQPRHIRRPWAGFGPAFDGVLVDDPLPRRSKARSSALAESPSGDR